MGLGWSGMPHSRWIPSGSRGQVPWQGVAVPPQTHLLSPPCFPAQLVLLPRVSELPGFHGAEAAARREELERYRCLEAFRMAPPHPLAQACARLVCSVSALLHGGALREWGHCGQSTLPGSGDVTGAVGEGGALRGAVGQAGWAGVPRAVGQDGAMPSAVGQDWAVPIAAGQDGAMPMAGWSGIPRAVGWDGAMPVAGVGSSTHASGSGCGHDCCSGSG